MNGFPKLQMHTFGAEQLYGSKCCCFDCVGVLVNVVIINTEMTSDLSLAANLSIGILCVLLHL